MATHGKFKRIVAIYELTVHNVYGNTDTTEGRGQTIMLGSFTESVAATEFAKGKGVMGCGADVRTETFDCIVPFFDNVKLSPAPPLDPFFNSKIDWGNAEIIRKVDKLNPFDPKVIRAQILEKLTPEERAFLELE